MSKQVRLGHMWRPGVTPGRRGLPLWVPYAAREKRGTNMACRRDYRVLKSWNTMPYVQSHGISAAVRGKLGRHVRLKTTFRLGRLGGEFFSTNATVRSTEADLLGPLAHRAAEQFQDKAENDKKTAPKTADFVRVSMIHSFCGRHFTRSRRAAVAYQRPPKQVGGRRLVSGQMHT
eukprot:gene7897-biopygen9113